MPTDEKLMITSNKIDLDSLSTLYNKNQYLELSLIEDNQFDSIKSEISEMYIDESPNYSK